MKCLLCNWPVLENPAIWHLRREGSEKWIPVALHQKCLWFYGGKERPHDSD